MFDNKSDKKFLISVKHPDSSDTSFVGIVALEDEFFFLAGYSRELAYQFTDFKIASAVSFELQSSNSEYCDSKFEIVEV